MPSQQHFRGKELEHRKITPTHPQIFLAEYEWATGTSSTAVAKFPESDAPKQRYLCQLSQDSVHSHIDDQFFE